MLFRHSGLEESRRMIHQYAGAVYPQPASDHEELPA
jgi:hypothetical protein